MADFGHFSDTDEDSAVEDLISQAKELSVLEQVSAINCSGFTDSVLPTELESRFRKLKSFPESKSKTPQYSDKRIQSLDHSIKSEFLFDSKQNPDGKSVSSFNSSHSSEIFSESKQDPDGKINLKENSGHGSVSAAVPVTVAVSSPLEQSKSKSKSKSNSFSSPLSSPNSWMDSSSPPQKKGCFWCSPKSVSKKKSRENSILDGDLDWGKTDEFLSDLNIFSVKEQEKILKKAMEEEEKVSREAEKIVKWAKQASMRMNDRGVALDDELSDDSECN